MIRPRQEWFEGDRLAHALITLRMNWPRPTTTGDEEPFDAVAYHAFIDACETHRREKIKLACEVVEGEPMAAAYCILRLLELGDFGTPDEFQEVRPDWTPAEVWADKVRLWQVYREQMKEIADRPDLRIVWNDDWEDDE